MANILDSPRLMRSNVLNHLVESNVVSSREAFTFNLASKIVYDDPSVFSVCASMKSKTISSQRAHPPWSSCMQAISSLLKHLVERASRKSPDAMEVEEVSDKRSDYNKEEKSGNYGLGSVEEKMI